MDIYTICRRFCITPITPARITPSASDSRLQDPLYVNPAFVHPSKGQYASHPGGLVAGPPHPEGANLLYTHAVPGVSDWILFNEANGAMRLPTLFGILAPLTPMLDSFRITARPPVPSPL